MVVKVKPKENERQRQRKTVEEPLPAGERRGMTPSVTPADEAFVMDNDAEAAGKEAQGCGDPKGWGSNPSIITPIEPYTRKPITAPRQ